MILRSCGKQRQVWFFLIAFLLAWGKGALAMPLLSMAMGHSHEVFLTYEHGENHLIFQHSENRHDHGHHSNHEFHISFLKHQAATATKTVKLFKSWSVPITDQLMPESVHIPSLKKVLQPPPEVNPILVSLRSIVLIV